MLSVMVVFKIIEFNGQNTALTHININCLVDAIPWILEIFYFCLQFRLYMIYEQYLAFISLRKICRSKHNNFRDRNDQS